MTDVARLRSPSEIGYLAWLVQRAAAIALLPLLALHTGVALFPGYGFAAAVRWTGYGALLDLTLALVVLHGVLGVRATVAESRFGPTVRRAIVWSLGLGAVLLFGYRVFG